MLAVLGLHGGCLVRRDWKVENLLQPYLKFLHVTIADSLSPVLCGLQRQPGVKQSSVYTGATLATKQAFAHA